MVMAMRFKRLSNCIVFSVKLCSLVVALRIELSATRLSAGYGQPALDYRLLPFAPRKLRYFHGVKGDFSRVCRNRTALDRPKRPVPAITLHAR